MIAFENQNNKKIISEDVTSNPDDSQSENQNNKRITILYLDPKDYKNLHCNTNISNIKQNINKALIPTFQDFKSNSYGIINGKKSQYFIEIDLDNKVEEGKEGKESLVIMDIIMNHVINFINEKSNETSIEIYFFFKMQHKSFEGCYYTLNKCARYELSNANTYGKREVFIEGLQNSQKIDTSETHDQKINTSETINISNLKAKNQAYINLLQVKELKVDQNTKRSFANKFHDLLAPCFNHTKCREI